MSSLPPSADGPKSTIKTNSHCHVCGDSASIINYGALSCPSCRTFFRRNGFYTKEVSPCRFGGDCTVTKLTRKICAACRFAKCLAVGMSPELIRKEDLSKPKRKNTTSPSQEIIDPPVMPIPQESALDHPPGDPYLNSSEWTHISNVVHAFDTFSPIPDIRRTIQEISISAYNSRFDLSQSLQIISSFSNFLQLFISSTPDFKILTASEQWSLLERNMLGLLSVGGSYLMRESGIFDRPEYEMVIVPLYGNEVVQQVKNLSTGLDCDPIIIKLILVAFAFSSNCFTKPNRGNIDKDSLLYGTFRLLGSQNVYVELIWKYLNHRYNFDESVQCFSILTKRLLDTLKLSIEIYENNQIYQRLIDEIIEQVQQSSIINEKTIIPLWGKS